MNISPEGFISILFYCTYLESKVNYRGEEYYERELSDEECGIDEFKRNSSSSELVSPRMGL